jgi:hypothetical protein
LLRSILIVACGLVPLLIPVVVWLAWSPAIFWLTLAASGAALLAIHA